MRRTREPILLAVIAVAQIALFTRLLDTAFDFDEGVYLLSLEALRSGQQLGTDIFAAQPPAFYWLLQSIAATVGDSPDRVRLGVALMSLLGTGAAWYLARSIAGPVAGVLAASLLLISPPLPLFAARVLADLPALWLTLGALALGAMASRRGSTIAGVGAGVATALAVATKPSAVIAIPILLVILLSGGGSRRARLTAATVGVAGASVVILAVNARAIGALWTSVVTYHRRAGSTPDVLDRWATISDLFNPRTPVFWIVVAATIVFAVRLMRRVAFPTEAALWAWVALSFLFIASYTPLHYNHLVALPVPLALAAATSLGAQVAAVQTRYRTFAIVALAVLVGAGYLQQWRRVAIAEEAQTAAEIQAAATLGRATRPGDLVVTDLPVSAVLADRSVPGPIIDTANLRFETGLLTPGGVLTEIDRACVKAVVVGRSFADKQVLRRGLHKRFAQRSSAEGVTVYFDRRRPCEPIR